MLFKLIAHIHLVLRLKKFVEINVNFMPSDELVPLRHLADSIFFQRVTLTLVIC